MMLIRIASTLLTVAYEWSLYFVSFLGPAIWIYRNRSSGAPFLLAMGLLGYVWAGLTFLVLLILTKRLLLPRMPTGHVSTRSKEASLWYLAVSLITIYDRSPFRGFTEINTIAPLFLRGMGGRIPPSASFGTRAMVFEPWSVRMGKDVAVGAYAVISGHVAVGENLILGDVIVGDNVVIGARSIVLPDVRIGNNVRIGAGAIVTRGTVIPDGETWVGVPARKLQRRETIFAPEEQPRAGD